MGERRGTCRVLVGKPEGKNHLEDLGIDGRIILKCTFKEFDGRARIGFIWLRTGTGGGLGGSCECGNEPLASIKCREFLS
jgi:hypothetical protein